ncbi:MAG TPA: nuclear transport factor 2 family protein [Salinimicrobium catena]|uniref:Nuclear transport factor 2 family protein n=1 Tax=Salinimicrobium catena TaxID=390640 RepID=A0A7C2M9M4_9FLAO|nr:nuclear transport factor 2 family protein [Salinimicrobium catena]
MKKLVIFTAVSLLLLGSCQEKEKEVDRNVATHQSNYEVASDRYSELSDEALDRMSSLDFDAWGELLADNVEYYFPDGDADTRTILRGKEEVVNWWKNWKETTGIDTMKFTDRVHIPVKANEKLNYSGLTGVIVISYFSNEMIYNGQPAQVRTNVAVHYTEDSLIDRFYTYYDRTPILKVVNANVLDIVVKGDSAKVAK